MSIVNSRLSALLSDKEKSSYLAKIRADKDRLTNGGSILPENSHVEPEVAESWLESYRAGVDPYASTNSESLDYEALSACLDMNADIISIVEEAIEPFRRVLKKAISSVFYADRDGVVLCLFEGDVSNELYRQFGTRVGGVWREDITGTSAISLCVKHQDIVQLVGPEHYRVVMQDHLTTAVPIHDSEGVFIGVLAMTTLHNKLGTGLSYTQPYTLGLATVLASSIEASIKLKANSYEPQNTQVDQRKAASLAQSHDEDNRFPSIDDLVGQSVALSNVRKLARQAALAKMNVLISGEMGVGKFTLAKAIAAERDVESDSLAVLSFSGVPESFAEEELFGRERSGVVEKIGILEQAKDGVLIVLEIGDIPMRVQHAFLTAIEDRSFCRVGGSTRISLGSFQIVSTSEEKLKNLVASKRVRSDLAIALSPLSIDIPPLRERREDERMLIGFLARQEGDRLGVPTPRFTSRAMEVLLKAPLSGNVRQLRNAIQYAIIVSGKQTIDEGDFPLTIEEGARPVSLDFGEGGGVMTLKESERKAIAKALAFTNGNIREAGRVLGIGRSTLYRKMSEYRIEK